MCLMVADECCAINTEMDEQIGRKISLNREATAFLYSFIRLSLSLSLNVKRGSGG